MENSIGDYLLLKGKRRYDKNASHPYLMTLQVGHTLLGNKSYDDYTNYRASTKEEKIIMKWEYNEPHTNSIYSTIEYNDCYTRNKDR